MKNFNISHRNENDCIVLDLQGELDAHTASELEKAFQDLIARDQIHIIVNFRELEYIASAGLGVFMAYIEDVRKDGGDIKLTNMNDKVFNVFDLLGFPALYDIFEDESEAIQRFSNS
ncbi:anti-sigma factor antagonist [Rhodohalobacter sp. SW132]|uniref:STAS domain-containing protein n=1 Tax=Rhodohalobacter sp. SW132 TaxID=2293433 RepID=UPI000E22FAE6|nr:STAS domain-containing protein [Rhodohalobacter sp. SW132]REL24864.1 anti-sigma factor antagonist [Rhodohalobacter sp. SW132]